MWETLFVLGLLLAVGALIRERTKKPRKPMTDEEKMEQRRLADEARKARVLAAMNEDTHHWSR